MPDGSFPYHFFEKVKAREMVNNNSINNSVALLTPSVQLTKKGMLKIVGKYGESFRPKTWEQKNFR